MADGGFFARVCGQAGEVPLLVFDPMARVLIVTPEPIARRLAGPAIRACHIARVLAEHHEVTLVSSALPPNEQSLSPIDGRRVHGPAAIHTRYDAAIVMGNVLIAFPELAESDMPLVIDWFDPFHTEALHRLSGDAIGRIDLIEGARVTLAEQARRGDFFLCSNEQQREHWLGWLAAAGRLNHLAHDADPLFANLITIAPFGLGREAPRLGSPIRRSFDTISRFDPIVLWAGGMHDWLDPLSVIEAVPVMLDKNPDTRLVFLAGPHPNTSIETMGVRGEAITLARKMRLFGKHVMFVNQWVDYGERLTWMQEATIGIVADGAHLESRYSHRTRLLDHLGAGLPTVSTAGDPLSAQLEAAGAAITCDRTIEGIGNAVGSIINDDERLGEMSRAAQTLGARLSWEQTLAPLVRWLEAPQVAIDRRPGANTGRTDGSAKDRLTGRIKMHLDDGGVTQVAKRGLRSSATRAGAARRRKLGR